jgi:hypothetical protein
MNWTKKGRPASSEPVDRSRQPTKAALRDAFEKSYTMSLS